MPLAAELLHEIAKAQALQALRGMVLAAEEVRDGGGGRWQVAEDHGLALGAGHQFTATMPLGTRSHASTISRR